MLKKSSSASTRWIFCLIVGHAIAGGREVGAKQEALKMFADCMKFMTWRMHLKPMKIQNITLDVFKLFTFLDGEIYRTPCHCRGCNRHPQSGSHQQ